MAPQPYAGGDADPGGAGTCGCVSGGAGEYPYSVSAVRDGTILKSFVDDWSRVSRRGEKGDYAIATRAFVRI